MDFIANKFRILYLHQEAFSLVMTLLPATKELISLVLGATIFTPRVLDLHLRLFVDSFLRGQESSAPCKNSVRLYVETCLAR